MTGLRGARRAAGALAVVAVACLVAGFVWFVQVASRRQDAAPGHVDGIVALTGGPGRIERALRLLAEGKADRLLVTGIGGGTDLQTLGRLAGVDTAPLAARITLGRYAESTRGNGVEAAAWAARNNIRSLIVVTAGYHMPRALAELRQALLGVELFALPAEAGSPEHRPSLKLAAEEYAKYLFTVSGLAAWLPRREASAAPTG